MSMNRLLDSRLHYDRRGGPAATAAGDGLEGCYSAVLHTAPAGSSVQVVIPAISLTSYYTANISAGFTGNVGDHVLVAFDEQKVPWVLSPSGVAQPIALPPNGPASGVLSGTYPNPGMATGAAAANVGALGGDLGGSLPNPTVVKIGGLPPVVVSGSSEVYIDGPHVVVVPAMAAGGQAFGNSNIVTARASWTTAQVIGGVAYTASGGGVVVCGGAQFTSPNTFAPVFMCSPAGASIAMNAVLYVVGY